jgi:GntR family transcriptional regulator
MLISDNKQDLPLKSFQRLQNILAEVIANTPAGERLPSEPELARRLGTSRATLREAMRTFEGQGVIRRRQGLGTFVVSHTHVIQSGLEVLESIESLARKIQLEVSMGELQVSRVKTNVEQSEMLNVSLDTILVKISRVIKADDRPVAYLVDLLPEDILTDADLKVGFTGSVLDLLLQRGTPALANSLAEVQAVAAEPDIARLLEIQRGDVLLKFAARLLTTTGRIIDYSLSYFLPGYFKFFLVRRVGGG